MDENSEILGRKGKEKWGFRRKKLQNGAFSAKNTIFVTAINLMVVKLTAVKY